MTRSIARSLVVVVTCLAILLTQATGAGAAGGTLDRQLGGDDFAESVETVAEEIDGFWAELFSGTKFDYESAEVVVFEGTTETGCGIVKAGRGSLYCPDDATIYFDLESLAAIADEHGAIPAVVEIARQYGFHIMALEQPTDEVAERDPADPRQLAADCFTGLWVVIAETGGLMPLGTTSEIVSYLAATTEASDETEHPGALRVEQFLSGYYLADC